MISGPIIGDPCDEKDKQYDDGADKKYTLRAVHNPKTMRFLVSGALASLKNHYLGQAIGQA